MQPRASAWVEQHRGRVGLPLQVFPNDTPTDKARHLLAAGRLAEALGFDAFFVGDTRPGRSSPGCTSARWRSRPSTSASG